MDTPRARIVVWLSRLLVAAGLVCLGLWLTATLRARTENARYERELERLLAAERTVVSPLERPRALPGDPEPGRPAAVSPQENPVRPPRPTHPGERRVIGRIDVARVNLGTVIVEGTDDDALRGGAGHFPETPLPHQTGNVALAGHRDSYFRGLRQLRADDEIVVTTPEGTFRYEVQWMRVVDPEDVHVLAASPERLLTLVTCYPFDHVGPAPRRFVVRARQHDGRRLASTSSRTTATDSTSRRTDS